MWDWDEAKRQANRAKHGVDFAQIDGFDWGTCTHARDHRMDYGELRVVSAGYIGGRLHLVVWTPRGETRRIISLRKANDREEKAYRIARAAD
jgi:uncharacterized DUF497 family protein